jgi:hypothetical protein
MAFAYQTTFLISFMKVRGGAEGGTRVHIQKDMISDLNRKNQLLSKKIRESL